MHVNFTLEIRFVTQKNMSENGNGPEASDRVKDLEKGSLESILPGQRSLKSGAGKIANRSELENGVSPNSPFLAQAAARSCASSRASRKL